MREKTPERENANQSSDKLLKIIECLAANRLPKRLSALAEQLGMPQATVLRYLRTLCQQGYAYHDEVGGGYALTWRICRLSDAVRINLALRSMASGFLDDLANRLNISTCLVVENNCEAMYLDFVDSPHGVRDTMSATIRIGKRAPLHTTASGKLILSSYSDRQIDRIVDEVGLERLTANTITDREQLARELEKIRKQGYSVDDEECEVGHRCVSVPLWDYAGRIVAALSAYDATEYLSYQKMEDDVLPALFEAAKQISFRLGYQCD